MSLDINFEIFSDNFKKHLHVKSNLLVKPKNMPANGYKYAIAIPTYKRPKLLLEAIESCINQNYDKNDWQIVIVDNDPDNNTDILKLVNKLGSISNFFYYKNEQNIGMFGNWNRCVELAQSEFVITLSDDDLLKPHFLYEIDKFIIKKPEANMIFSKYDYFGSGFNESNIKKTWFKKMILKLSKDKTRKIDLIDFFLRTFGFSASGLLLRRSLALNLGGYDDTAFPSSDYYFLSKFVFNFGNSYFVNKTLASYRVEENESMKYEVCDVNPEMHFKIKKKMIEKIQFNSKTLYSIALLKYIKDIEFMKFWGHDFTYKINANLELTNLLKNKVYLIYLNIFESLLRKSRNISYLFK